MLPETMERIRHEVSLQTLLGNALTVTKGYAAPEVGETLARAYDLCQQLADPVQLFGVLAGLRTYVTVRGEARKSLEYANYLSQIAQQIQDPRLLLSASMGLGVSDLWVGNPTTACEHFERGIASYNPRQHRSQVLHYNATDPKVGCLGFSGWGLWLLGYPDLALQKSQESLAFVRDLSHPYSVIWALLITSWFHIFRREEPEITERLNEALSLCTMHGILDFLIVGKIFQGRVLMRQGKKAEGLQQLQENLSLREAMQFRMLRPILLAYQAEGYQDLGQVESALVVVTEALDFVTQSGECFYEAELYRLKGELTLQKFQVSSSTFHVDNPQSAFPNPQLEAEKCFLKALDIAQQQQAKSWELRAATSLARLWHQQGKSAEAHTLLSEVYTWFTEGFDTKDLQEAKGLLQELSH